MRPDGDVRARARLPGPFPVRAIVSMRVPMTLRAFSGHRSGFPDCRGACRLNDHRMPDEPSQQPGHAPGALVPGTRPRIQVHPVVFGVSTLLVVLFSLYGTLMP